MKNKEAIIVKGLAMAVLLGGILSAGLAGAAAADAEKNWPSGRVVLINHRGLSPGYPENTLLAIKNSISLGVDMIEIDIRSTKDRVPVIMHDDTVSATTNGKGAVESLTLSELKKLDAGVYSPYRLRWGRTSVMNLTADWLFAIDPENKGTAEEWFRANMDRKDWMKVSAARNWQEFKQGYYGNAWYVKELIGMRVNGLVTNRPKLLSRLIDDIEQGKVRP